MKFSVLIISLLVIVYSCSEDDNSLQVGAAETPYYPLVVDHYIDYEVNKVTYYNHGKQRDTLNYMIRNQISSEYLDATDQPTFIIDQSIKYSNSTVWNYHKSLSAYFRDNEMVITTDNIKQVVLQLPFEKNIEWNGNQYFDDDIDVAVGSDYIKFYKSWQSKYLKIDQEEKIGENTYQDVHTIQLADSENRLEQRYGIEKYAKNVGLIYRELRILDTQCFEECQNILWEEKAEKGIILTQKILNHNG